MVDINKRNTSTITAKKVMELISQSHLSLSPTEIIPYKGDSVNGNEHDSYIWVKESTIFIIYLFNQFHIQC